MQTAHPSLFIRDDTLFGVCEALGEDLRFNPVFLRLTLAVLLLWNPVGVLCAYAGGGAVVLLSRLVFPNARQASTPGEGKAADRAPSALPQGENDESWIALAAAA